jgi:hypothetical protein
VVQSRRGKVQGGKESIPCDLQLLPTSEARPFSQVGVNLPNHFDWARVFLILTETGGRVTNFGSRKVRIAILTVLAIAIIALAAVTLLWDPFGLFASTPGAQQENKILFVGAGFNQSNAFRNSNTTGDFSINVTTAGRIQLTLDDETYYPPGPRGNGSSPGLSVHTIQSGFITVNGARFNFVSAKLCNATIASTQTNGSTVIAYATCNASTTPVVITTGLIQISTAGVWQFDYSLYVPDNATIGTYLVDIQIQNLSAQNFANMSNNLVYVLTVNVTQ